MEAVTKPDLAEEIAGALAWWREAGVDCDLVAEPRSWLGKAEPTAQAQSYGEPVASDAAPPAIGSSRAADPASTVDLAGLPDDLGPFHQWWLTASVLDVGHGSARVAPRGPAGAPLMVLTATPEAEDRDRLLSGPQGKLLDTILAALGVAPEQAYVASVIPHHDPVPDATALAATGLGQIALHHISLVAPQRVLLLGNLVLALLGHDPANKPALLPDINHETRKFRVLAEMDLAALLAQPGLKAGLWGRLLDWTGK